MEEFKFKNKIVNYKIINPGGNITALVTGDDYTNEDKKIINNYILKENKNIEQVGFLSKKENKLEMAGGEFCLNATRCAIWEYLKGKKGTIKLKVSGNKEIVQGGIDEEKNVYVKLNINKTIDELIEEKEIFNYIKLDGILIAVVDEQNSKEYIKRLKNNEKSTKEELKETMNDFITKEKAVGIIFLEKENKKIKIYPIIWVKTVDTLYYETACGSGSLATAIYENYTYEMNQLEVIQPSGYSINIILNKKGSCIKDAIITGKII